MPVYLRSRGSSSGLFPATTSRVVVPIMPRNGGIKSYQDTCRVFSDEVPMASELFKISRIYPAPEGVLFDDKPLFNLSGEKHGQRNN